MGQATAAMIILDFADALHMVSTEGVFHTFDEQCARKAKARGLRVVRV